MDFLTTMVLLYSELKTDFSATQLPSRKKIVEEEHCMQIFYQLLTPWCFLSSSLAPCVFHGYPNMPPDSQLARRACPAVAGGIACSAPHAWQEEQAPPRDGGWALSC